MSDPAASPSVPSSALHSCAHPDDLRPDWPREFGRKGPQRLELEIGPGRGAFALDHAEAHPEMDLLAIEARRSDVEEIRARAARRKLTNLLVFHGDAKLLVPRWLGAGQLACVHVQFPDPWWKQRHHKRRMVDVDLAALLRRLLCARGEVDFRTDVHNYATEAVVTWEAAGFVNVDGPLSLSAAIPETLSTRERRYVVTGQPVYRARFTNPSVAAPGELQLPGERSGREWKDVRRK
jgi:tRNA (guanine-N7-)-methyltransferase